jgi:DNA invertase Pin-like site-specific DNA recombinase
MGSEQVVPAVIYAAKSTEDKHGSIPDQLLKTRRLCEREGWPIFGEEEDEGFSAYSGNRGPGLEAIKVQAIDLAAEHGQCLLVALHSDRVARGAGDEPGAADHLVEVVAHLRRHGVRLRTVEDDFFADDRIGLLMAAVQGQRNSEDSRRKSEAVRAGHKRRRESGRYHGGPAAYGYTHRRNAEDERELVPDRSVAPIVKRIFAEYLAGATQLQITRHLDADHVPTANGGKWHQGTVRAILANPVYAGLLRDGDELIDAAHEPIVDRETWEQVAQLREAKRRTHKRGRPSAGVHLFRKGFLKCGVCGGSMVPRSSKNRNGTMHESYRCYERWRDPSACSMMPVPRAAVDAAVYAYFEQVGLDVEATREQLAQAIERRVAEIKALLGGAEQEAREAESRLARVKGDYTSGGLPLADWLEFKAELEPQRDAAHAEVERLAAQFAEVKAGEALRDVEQELLEQLAQIRAAVAGAVKDAEGVEAVRSALLRLFDGFVLHRGVPELAHVELIGEHWLEPVVSQRAVEGYDEKMRPVLARKPLDQAANNYANVFQP